MKRVIDYNLSTGRWEIRVANDDVRLSAGEVDAQVVTCDITSWDDARLAEFLAQDQEAQVFDLECLEFEVFSREWCIRRDTLK
jgi:hypothetical protein